MDVFALRDRVVDEYRRYVSGFVAVKDPRTRDFVDAYFSGDHLWPEPLVKLNPAFEPGRWLRDLVKEGVLHPECEPIFRRRDAEDTLGKPIRLHLHQEDALDRFLRWGYPGGQGPVTFAKYTGQEDDSRRAEIIRNPPDILLTNFVMLELILTRTGPPGPNERDLIAAAQGLEFLVLDELHTYRGRQGADVAMLIRRVRERCGADTMRCVGTSATLAGIGSREERQAEVAAVASQLFGMEVPSANVIGETLRPATRGTPPAPTEQRRGELVVRSNARKYLPQRVRVTTDGRVDSLERWAFDAWFMPAPFRFCFGCGVT